MQMYKLKLTYEQFIEELIKTEYRVIAPLKNNTTDLTKPGIKQRPMKFGEISSVSETALPQDYINTVRSAKEFMFPISEPILEFEFNNKEIKLNETLNSPSPSVIVGLRPCDARAFFILDDIFSYSYKDNFYLQRRSNTLLIGIACSDADEACFCNTFSVNANENPEGSDIFLKKSRDGYYTALAVTLKGENFLADKKNIFKKLEGEVQYENSYSELSDKMREPLNTKDAQSWLENNFDSKLWDEFASRCLGCASCAYLCPTCHCFDIVDEVKYSKGLRRKNWDACQFSLFTKHASGHNPRDVQSKRYRQRVMHKFKYYEDRFNKPFCTGCGRCIRSCPVNLDIYEVVKTLSQNE